MKVKAFMGPGGRRGRWLIALGALLVAYSLVCLYRIDPLAQYIAPAAQELTREELSALPEGEPAPASELRGQLSDWEDMRGELGEDAQAGMAAFAYDYSVTAGGQTKMATLVCAGEGWFDAHPRFLTDGYLFSQSDYENGAHKAVLDEELAFQLFPTTDACGSRVQLDGTWYDVIGVVRRADMPGDTDEYRIYIPITAAADARMQTDYVHLECRTDNSGTKRALQNVAEDVLGDGSYYDTEKEVMRASMIVRIITIVFTLYFIARLLHAWNNRTIGLIKGWNEEVMQRYFKTMLPKVVCLSVLQIAGYAALALGAWAVLGLIIEPMYVFTEWIPDNFVSWSSISGRIEELLTENAQIVRYQTREFASIKFYGAITRWGMICMLSGLVLYRIHPEKHKKMCEKE